MRHVLVTGGAGFIGSHTVRELVQRGYRVRVLDELRPPVHTAGSRPELPLDVELLIGSVDDRAALDRALEGVDAVLHLAAYQDYLPDFSTFYRVNTVGTALLYELIVEKGLAVDRVVVAATQAEYGEGPYRCDDHGLQYPNPRTEAQLQAQRWEVACPVCDGPAMPVQATEETVRPHSTYAMSKRAAEEAALALGRRYGISTVTLRYSIVQGAGQSFRNAYSGALRAFAVQALHGKRPLVYEDGQQQRDYVWIGDVVAANLLALTASHLDFATFNVGGDRAVTVLELAGMVVEAAGLTLEPEVPGLYRVGDTRHIRSHVGKLCALGWTPTLDQRSMVQAYVDWARAQPDLYDSSDAAVRRMRELGVLRDSSSPPRSQS